MVFTPWTLALNCHWQGIFFMAHRFVQEKVLYTKYEREEFELSDGQIIGIEWHIDKESGGIPTKSENGPQDKRPILVLVGGLGGFNQASYIKNMIPLANKKGYKCVMIGYRGTGGIPVTHGKTYSSASWRDIKEPCDYLKKAYGQDRRMHLYACSLGALVCTNYLCRDDKAPFESAIFYGTPFNINVGVDRIINNLYGIYNHAFGASLKAKLR